MNDSTLEELERELGPAISRSLQRASARHSTIPSPLHSEFVQVRNPTRSSGRGHWRTIGLTATAVSVIIAVAWVSVLQRAGSPTVRGAGFTSGWFLSADPQAPARRGAALVASGEFVAVFGGVSLDGGEVIEMGSSMTQTKTNGT